MHAGINRSADLAQSLDDVQRALQLDPKLKSTLRRRGQILYLLGRHEEALADFNASIQLWPHNAVSYGERGRTHFALHQYQEALVDFSKAMEIAPVYWRNYKDREAVYFILEQYDKSLTDLAKSLELNAKDTSALVWIPPALVAKCPDRSFREGLLKLANTAVEKTGDSVQTRRYRIRVCLALNQLDIVRSDFQSLLMPDNSALYDHYQHALFCLLMDDAAKYRQSCGIMLERLTDTDDPAEANFTAWTCCLASNAVDDYELPIGLTAKAIETQPTSDQFLSTCGAILYRAGRVEESIERLTELDRRLQNPNAETITEPADTWYFLAMAHHKAGNGELAREYLNKANQQTDEVLANEEHPPVWDRRDYVGASSQRSRGASGNR